MGDTIAVESDVLQRARRMNLRTDDDEFAPATGVAYMSDGQPLVPTVSRVRNNIVARDPETMNQLVQSFNKMPAADRTKFMQHPLYMEHIAPWITASGVAADSKFTETGAAKAEADVARLPVGWLQ